MGVIVGDGDHEMDLDHTTTAICKARPLSNWPTGSENITTHSNHNDNRGDCHHANDRPLEPHLAILQVEAHVGQVADEVWLIGNLLAKASPD